VGNAGETIGGSFARWSGTITMDPDRPETADIAITVDLTSASVGDASQDGMLRGAEFFDTSNFASATFRASSARRTGGNSYSARGTLDLKGQSRPQTITFRLTGSGLTRHVEGSATIARADFGIGTGSSGENLAPNVAVSFSFDAEAR
jgi:polyisoprenoid-binding protein YceI